jgi:TonB family protein
LPGRGGNLLGGNAGGGAAAPDVKYFGNRNLNASSPITRTAAGEQELAVPSHGLSLTQRRLLTLLDTPGSLSDLQARSGSELARLERDLARLAETGLIASESTDSPIQPARNEAPRGAARAGGSRRGLGIAGALVAVCAAIVAWMGWPGGASAPAAAAKPAAAVAAVPAAPVPGAATTSNPAAADAPPTPPAAAAVGDEPAAIVTTVLDYKTPPHPRDAGARAGRADTRDAIHDAAKREAAKREAPLPAGAAKTAASTNAASIGRRASDAEARRAPGPQQDTPRATPHAMAANAVAVNAAATAPTVARATVTSFSPPSQPAPTQVGSSAAPTQGGHSPSPTSPTQVGDSTPPMQLAMAAPPVAAARPAAPIKLTPLVHDAPQFPREALRRDIDRGTVRARLTIDAQGKVSDIAILEASPRGVFERAVRSALSHWKFAPGQSGRSTDVDVAFKRD